MYNVNNQITQKNNKRKNTKNNINNNKQISTIKECQDIPTKYYRGLDQKDKKQQCKDIKKSQKLYKKKKYYPRRNLKSFKHKESKHITEFKQKYGITLSDLKIVEEVTGVPVEASKEVINRGRGAYFSGSRPNQNMYSWSRARLASFILKHNAYKRDYDIWKKYKIDKTYKPPPNKK